MELSWGLHLEVAAGGKEKQNEKDRKVKINGYRGIDF